MSGRRRELKVSASDSDDVAAEYEAAFDEAVAELEEKGVALSMTAPKIDFHGMLPSNLPSLDSKDLGEPLWGPFQSYRLEWAMRRAMRRIYIYGV